MNDNKSPLSPLLSPNLSRALSFQRGHSLSSFSPRYLTFIILALIAFISLHVYSGQDGLSTGLLAKSLVTYAPHSRLSDRLFPSEEVVFGWEAAQVHNQKTMRDLLDCLANENCKPNQDKVILAASFHWRQQDSPWMGGETIWLASLQTSFQDLGYSVFYTCPPPPMYDLSTTLSYWILFRHLVKVILAEPGQIQQCVDDYRCIKSSENPLGIPIWQMLAFNIWSGPAHYLGNNFTLSIDDLPDSQNHYLGYSLERTCTAPGIVKPQDRPNRAFVFGKDARYFNQKDFTWSADDFTNLTAALDLQYVAGYTITPETDLDTIHIPKEIENLGFMSKDEFLKQVGNSRVLIGIGNPLISPTPHDAACLGVPFINPILAWDPADPWNRAHWITQHNGMLLANPPHVYFVHRGDSRGFRKAVADALANPIDSYIYPTMTMDALNERVAQVVDFDWRELAAKIIPTLEDGKNWTL